MIRDDAEKDQSTLVLVSEKKECTVLTGRSLSSSLRAEGPLFQSVDKAVFKGTEVPLLQLAMHASYPRHLQPAAPPSYPSAGADVNSKSSRDSCGPKRYAEEISELAVQMARISEDRWRAVIMNGDLQALCGHPSANDFEGVQSIFDAYSGTFIEAPINVLYLIPFLLHLGSLISAVRCSSPALPL